MTTDQADELISSGKRVTMRDKTFNEVITGRLLSRDGETVSVEYRWGDNQVDSEPRVNEYECSELVLYKTRRK